MVEFFLSILTTMEDPQVIDDSFPNENFFLITIHTLLCPYMANHLVANKIPSHFHKGEDATC